MAAQWTPCYGFVSFWRKNLLNTVTDFCYVGIGKTNACFDIMSLP